MSSNSAALNPPSIEEAAAARRAELSRDWPTAGQVDEKLSETLGARATELRKAGRLLAVYLTEPHHHFRFPSWQFQPDGQPIAQFAEILSILLEFGPYLDQDGRTTGWGETEWFHSPHVLLDDERPCDMLGTEPQRVLDAARVEYIEENDAGGF